MHIDLAKYIEKYEPNGIRLRVVRSYLYQIAKGVEFCHKRAVIHRDLKTDNILISENGLVKVSLQLETCMKLGLTTGRFFCFTLSFCWF